MNIQFSDNPLNAEQRYVLGKILENGSIADHPQGAYLVAPLTPMTLEFLKSLRLPGFRNNIAEPNDLPSIEANKLPDHRFSKEEIAAEGITLRGMCDQFLEEKRRQGSHTSRTTFDRLCRNLVDLLGGRTMVREITRQDILYARKMIVAMPSFYPMRFPGMTIEQAVNVAEEQNLERRSIRTVNQMLIRITALFNWAESEWLVDKNPAQNLAIQPGPSDIRFRRQPFSIDQLNNIFHAPIYTGCIDDESHYKRAGPNKPRRHRFWVPLIGLYSGLRLNEILQLNAVDIRDVDGIPCFAVTHISSDGAEDKRIKTQGSERCVPIHSELIKIGLLDYADTIRQSGERKLFPQVLFNQNRGTYSQNVSTWFSQLFLKSIGVYTPETTFHSFRHNFKDALERADTGVMHMRRLCGWSLPRLNFDYNYGTPAEVAELSKTIENVRYPDLDLSHLCVGD